MTLVRCTAKACPHWYPADRECPDVDHKPASRNYLAALAAFLADDAGNEVTNSESVTADETR